MKFLVNIFFLLIWFFTHQDGYAHDRVVVVPLQGENVVKQPPFRLVPLELNVDGSAPSSGRLQFTQDLDPTPKSAWGDVCSGCFEGDSSNCENTSLREDTASRLVCTDLGYSSGIFQRQTSLQQGVAAQILSNVQCVDSATTFSDCAYEMVEACDAGQAVAIKCFNKVPSFELPAQTVECGSDFAATGGSLTYLFGVASGQINDSDLTSSKFEELPIQDEGGIRSFPLANTPGADSFLIIGFIDQFDNRTDSFRHICGLSPDAPSTEASFNLISVNDRRWRASFSYRVESNTLIMSPISFQLNP